MIVSSHVNPMSYRIFPYDVIYELAFCMVKFCLTKLGDKWFSLYILREIIKTRFHSYK